MAVTITVGDVVKSFETTVSGDEIQLLIDVVSTADACLDGAGVSAEKQELLKIYAIRHMLQLQANMGKGVTKSERAPSGAARSYSDWQGNGLESTSYGSLLKQLDSTGCLTNLLSNSQPMAFMSVGGGC